MIGDLYITGVAESDRLLNTDGTALTNLSGYRLMYGSQPGKYLHTVDVDNGLTRYALEDLPAGTYYIAMTARNSAGQESDNSLEVSIDVT